MCGHVCAWVCVWYTPPHTHIHTNTHTHTRTHKTEICNHAKNYVTWLVHMYHDSFTRHICIRRVTLHVNESCHICIRHITYDGVMSHINLCDVTCAYVPWIIHMWRSALVCDLTQLCVTWLRHMWCDVYICDVTRSHVTWLIQVWHDWFTCGTTHSYLTWLIHMWCDSFEVEWRRHQSGADTTILSLLLYFCLLLILTHVRVSTWSARGCSDTVCFNTLLLYYLLYYTLDKVLISDGLLRHSTVFTTLLHYYRLYRTLGCESRGAAVTRCSLYYFTLGLLTLLQ